MSSAAPGGLGKRIAEGREAEVFEWEPGTVLKRYRLAADAPRAEREAAATNAVAEAGGPAPRSLGLVTIDGRPGLVLERVDGPDLITTMARRPWTVPSAGTVMGRAHAAVNRLAAPGSLPMTRSVLERRLRSVDAAQSWRDAALRALDRLSDGERLCHNDLQPQNVLLLEAGAVVIDWPGATRGDPASDVARTMVILTVGAAPRTAPLAARLLGRPATTILLRRYLAAYRSNIGLDDQAMRAWMLPHAVARIAESISEERVRLERLVQRLLQHPATST